MKITVDKHWCPQNHRCPAIMVCPTKAIRQEGYGLPIIDQEKCIHCMKCTRYCPMGAIGAEEE